MGTESKKQYPSVFVPEQLVDLPNFVVELMIRNWCLIAKKPVPNCPFWRKEIAEKSPELKELAKRYGAELPAARNLLKVFGPGVLMKYYQESKMPGFTMLRDETKGKVLLALYKAQIKAKEVLIPQATVQENIDQEMPNQAIYAPLDDNPSVSSDLGSDFRSNAGKKSRLSQL